MFKRSINAVALIAGLAAAPAYAFVGGINLNQPSDWPEPGAFDQKAETVTQGATVATRGVTTVAPEPNNDEARGR